MYRSYLSSTEYQEIVNEVATDPVDRPPHCNPDSFHEPAVCAFCDGYYRRHPDFAPAAYVTPEANGWGGNQAPIVDDAKAAEEAGHWERIFTELDR